MPVLKRTGERRHFYCRKCGEYRQIEHPLRHRNPLRKKKKSHPRNAASAGERDGAKPGLVSHEPPSDNGHSGTKEEPNGFGARLKNDVRKPRFWIELAALIVVGVYTRQACVANTIASQNFEISKRPSISMGNRNGVIAEFETPSDTVPDAPIGLKVYFQNGGPSAALTFNVGMGVGPISLVARGFAPIKPFKPFNQTFSPLLRLTNKTHTAFGGSGVGGSIPPQSQYVEILPQQFSREQRDRAMRGEIAPVVDLMFDFCDEFGNYYCRWATLSWQGPPDNVFVENTEVDCGNVYSYPPARPDAVYLLPCEQPDERGKRERAERQSMLEAAANPRRLSQARGVADHD